MGINFQQQAINKTGIELPGYYNPGAINPVKYADQVQKRKLLWGNKKTEQEQAAKWETAKFSQDSDGRVASKFMRLMGIKDGEFINSSLLLVTPSLTRIVLFFCSCTKSIRRW